jgi:hypothetical protein
MTSPISFATMHSIQPHSILSSCCRGQHTLLTHSLAPSSTVATPRSVPANHRRSSTQSILNNSRFPPNAKGTQARRSPDLPKKCSDRLSKRFGRWTFQLLDINQERPLPHPDVFFIRDLDPSVQLSIHTSLPINADQSIFHSIDFLLPSHSVFD